jgi:hypothetical protein
MTSRLSQQLRAARDRATNRTECVAAELRLRGGMPSGVAVVTCGLTGDVVDLAPHRHPAALAGVVLGHILPAVHPLGGRIHIGSLLDTAEPQSGCDVRDTNTYIRPRRPMFAPWRTPSAWRAVQLEHLTSGILVLGRHAGQLAETTTTAPGGVKGASIRYCSGVGCSIGACMYTVLNGWRPGSESVNTPKPSPHAESMIRSSGAQPEGPHESGGSNPLAVTRLRLSPAPTNPPSTLDRFNEKIERQMEEGWALPLIIPGEASKTGAAHQQLAPRRAVVASPPYRAYSPVGLRKPGMRCKWLV